MVILGLSGFEGSPDGAGPHPYGRAGSPGAPFQFGPQTVPLQYHPLGLIGHDAAAAILVDGRLVASAAEERFTRIKHGLNLAGRTTLPRHAIAWCLEVAGCTWSDVDAVAHYCRFTPRSLEQRLARVGRGLGEVDRDRLAREYGQAWEHRVAPDVVRSRLGRIAGREIDSGKFVPVPHHLAHAAGTFYSSGFEDALCLTLDGYGEEESALWTVGTAAGLLPRGAIALPSSLGTLYQLVTTYLGFGGFGDEYKTMGLAAYGRPARFRHVFDELVVSGPDGAYDTSAMCRPDLLQYLRAELGPAEPPGEYNERGAAIAAAMQEALERAVLELLRHLRDDPGGDRLCLAGGVALNAVLNGRIVRSGLFRRVFVQPAAADDGAALGAALYAHHRLTHGAGGGPIPSPYWGPEFAESAIADALAGAEGIQWERVPDVEARTAELLARDHIVGWFQGRMELGPRALGDRSILAGPGSAELRDRLNAAVKGREPFRPFAPSVLAEDAAAFFDIPDDAAARYMVVTYPARAGMRERIPGVVHVDGSARVQVVHQADNPVYHRLLREFRSRTGLPVVLNTSFNRAGEPIVCCPEDAVRCFLRSGLDALAIGPFLVRRAGGEPS